MLKTIKIKKQRARRPSQSHAYYQKFQSSAKIYPPRKYRNDIDNLRQRHSPGSHEDSGKDSKDSGSHIPKGQRKAINAYEIADDTACRHRRLIPEDMAGRMRSISKCRHQSQGNEQRK